MATRVGPTMFFNTLNRKLESHVQDHLKKVYATMSLALIAATIGSYCHIYTNLLSAGLLSSLALIGFGLALTFTRDNGKNQNERLGYLLGFALCSGISMGPLLDFVIFLNPSIITTSLFATFLIFGSFSLSAIFSDHRKWIYAGGILMSGLSLLFFMSMLNIFIGSKLLYQAHLYIGFILVCGFVMYDTVVIIEKRRLGDTDFIGHTLLLFIDFIDVFRHLVVLLTQKEQQKRQRRRD